jgi:hypothetical protein
VLSWDVVAERTSEAMQACLERAPQAKQYYSDAFPVYDTLYDGAPHELRSDKLETYAIISNASPEDLVAFPDACTL